MKYTGKIDCCFVNSGAVFYRLKENLPLQTILSHLKNDEPKELATERWYDEQHWLADWNYTSSMVFSLIKTNFPVKDKEDFALNVEIEFNINKTAYQKTMFHGRKNIGPVRNINISNAKLVKINDVEV